jgi:prepilin-type N-terminal cleavage/methylation domain-containing protein
MAVPQRATTPDRGFTLIEVLVATAILVVVATGIAQLIALAVRTSEAARARTASAFLATQKMEQLRSLTWTSDETGASQSDFSTDLSLDPPAAGGTGLAPTPSGTLERSVRGYVDYQDAAGRWIGAGLTPPSGAVYVRRWAVLPLADDPDNARVLVVLAATLREEASIRGSPRPRLPEDTLLISLKTRQMAVP